MVLTGQVNERNECIKEDFYALSISIKTIVQKTSLVYGLAKIAAVPTLFIGDTKIAGVCSKETLEQIIKNELDKQKRQILMECMTCSIDGC